MAKVVWKYSILFGSVTSISIDKGGKLVYAGVDPGGQPCVWAETEENPMWSMNVNIIVVGTGHFVPDGFKHFMSFVQGPFVWHVYYNAD